MSDRPDYLGPRYRPGVPPAPPPTRWQSARARARALLWPPSPATWAALFALVVAGLGLFGLGFEATLSSRLPSAIDWQAASALLAREARPGDVVALSPPWAERAREVLPERLPRHPDAALPVLALPGFAAGDELLPGVRRVWLLSLTGAPGHRGTIASELAARAEAVDGPLRLGALAVTRYDLPRPLLPLAFFPDRLATASVRMGEVACPRDARGRFRCPGPAWQTVARQVREIDLVPRVCIFAHPPVGGAPLVLSFPDVPVGRSMRGHTGIAADAALDGNAPVRLAVRIDGEDVGFAEEPPGRPGWHPFQLDTARLAGKPRTVTFEVRAADPTRRWFCFDATTLP